MHNNDSRGIPITTPWVRERYGTSFLVSVGFHAILVFLFLFGGYLLPTTVIRIGSGSGGGTGGDVPTTVGVIDELSGGAGMVKPSIVPKPPALQEKTPPKEQDKAIPLPRTIENKRKTEIRETAKKTKPLPDTNMIPTAPEPGSGGTGGRSGGSGGGFGGGNGVSIGPGSGGFGDSWYARAVEKRIGENWDRPASGMRVEVIYSFYIAANGSVYGVKMEKSSGNPTIDMNAKIAILRSNPLSAPPPEFRGRPIQFVAQFIYPPNQ